VSSAGLKLIERELSSAQQKRKDLLDARNSMQAQVDEHDSQIAEHDQAIADLQRDWEHLSELAAKPVEPQPMPEPQPEPPEAG
jgi:chromosome segregation ATPase